MTGSSIKFTPNMKQKSALNSLTLSATNFEFSSLGLIKIELKPLKTS